MYEKREKQCGTIALVYYAAYWFFLLFCGKLQVLTQSKLFANIPYPLVFLLTVIFVYRREHSWRSLGFTRQNSKTDLWIAAAIVAASICVKVFFTWRAFGVLTSEHWFWILWQIPYFLFYIGAVEEILFRGFLQNYLFGLNLSSKLTFCIGALFFSFIHLPYQMYNRGFPSLLAYAVWSSPNLVYNFLFHLLLCLIAKKRGSIIIPIAIHFMWNYLF